MKRKLMLLMTCLFIGIGLVNAQISKVTGTVTSEEDGLPVVGASVLVKGTTQGTVTDIVNSKPIERRVIFESASGVLKYKKRKEEALRKLDKTQTNIERVLDVKFSLFLSNSALSLLEETKAISIPEKKAENRRMIMISIIVNVMIVGFLWVRDVLL